MKNKKLVIIFLLYSLTMFYFVLFNSSQLLLIIPIYIVYTLLLVLVFRPDLNAILGTFYYATGKTEKGLLYFKKAIDNDTKKINVYLQYAVYLMQNGDARSALKLLEKAKSKNKDILNDKYIALSIGSCYWQLGDLDSAILTLENLRAKYEYVNCSTLVTLGYIYLLKDDFDKALDITNKALEDEPESAPAWDNLGQIYIKTNEKDKAVESFLKALSFRDLVDSNYFLGTLYEEMGELEKAKEYFIKADNCVITSLNTVTKQQITSKIEKYNI